MENFKENLIFDSHAHYDDRRFGEDRDKLLLELPSKNVCGIINVGSNLKSSKFSVDLAKKYPYIWAAAGIHPHEAEKAYNTPNWAEQLKSLLQMEKVVALGEIGLDYHYDFSPRDIQKKMFEAQLKIAVEFDLPVVIHCREATEDTMEIVRRYKPKGVMHSFSGSVETATEVLELGMYVSLSGVVTFKNAKKPAEVASMIWSDRLLVETDAPYLTPEPKRGIRNDSSMIAYTAGKIAEIREISLEELLETTKKNACTLFGIDLGDLLER